MDPPGAEGIDRRGRDRVSGSSANFAPPAKAPASGEPRASGPRAPIQPSKIRGDPPDRVSDPWDQKRMTPGRASTEAGTLRSTEFRTATLDGKPRPARTGDLGLNGRGGASRLVVRGCDFL